MKDNKKKKDRRKYPQGSAASHASFAAIKRHVKTGTGLK